MDPHIILPCKTEEPEKPVAYTLHEPLRIRASLEEAQEEADKLAQDLGPGYTVVVTPLYTAYHHRSEDPAVIQKIFTNNYLRFKEPMEAA